MKSSSERTQLSYRAAVANQAGDVRNYLNRGSAAGLGFRLYPASEGAATHHVVHVADERVGRLEKELKQLRAEIDQLRSSKLVSLAALGSEKFRLKQSLWVEIDASDETGVSAHVLDLEEYGAGATEYEALDDLRAALVDTYSFLLSNEEKLGPSLVSQLARYRDLILVNE